MNKIIRRAIKKFDKINRDQLRTILESAADDVETLEMVIDSIMLGLLVCNTDHKLFLNNKFASRMLPLDSYEQSSEYIWSLVRDDDIASFLQKTLINLDRIEEMEFYVEKNNINRLLSISVLPLVHDKYIRGSLIIVDDITEKRVKEAKLHQIENLASLTNVAAGVAHEIKNPLASISIHIQLIQKIINNFKNDNERIDEYKKINKHLITVDEEINCLNKLVVDFLFAVRPMELSPIKSDINVLIKEIFDLVGLELKEKRITYKIDLMESLPQVFIDRRLIKQAILNLINNAVEAMNEKGKLFVKTEKSENEITISIRDTGPGISEDNKTKIFEPYWTTKIKGTGLGLTLVYKIINEHKGEINLQSKEGEGACFVITLPVPQTEKRLLDYVDSNGVSK